MAGPGVEEFDQPQATALARRINDELAESIKANPDRFVGLATVAYGDPVAAADEAERCVTRLGFKGVKLNSHVHGEYLDAKKFWGFWDMIEKLGVPVMLHPKDPPKGLLSLLDDYPGLTQAAWGFAIDTSTHALRLICSGLFDAYPKLRIVLGHLGEAIPFWMARIDNHWVRAPMSVPLKKLPSQYFRENFYVTTSGMFQHPAFQCVYQTLGADRMLFAVDYPYERMPDGSAFIDAVIVSESDKAKICHTNVEKLLGI
jgi:predicted TIM-barrel fold metal-dependent hydrolase